MERLIVIALGIGLGVICGIGLATIHILFNYFTIS